MVAKAGYSLCFVLFLQFFFLITGVSGTILITWISYHGGAHTHALLPVIASYFASSLVYFVPQSSKNTHKTTSSNIIKWKTKSFKTKTSINYLNSDLKIMLLSFYDMFANTVSFLSLIWSGSGVYQLVYSSIIIITASFRHFLIPNRNLSFQQWIACFIVTLGLLFSAFGQTQSHIHQRTNIFIQLMDAFAVIFWPLMATFLYALEYVLVEILLSSKNAPTSNEVCYKMGFYGSAFCTLFAIFYVIPNWKTIMIDEISEHDGNWMVVVLGYISLLLCNFGHNWTYFYILHASGAVSTGINQALRAIFVFVISGFCFCELQKSQCFNSFKFLSLIIVIVGVMRYTFVTTMKKIKPQIADFKV